MARARKVHALRIVAIVFLQTLLTLRRRARGLCGGAGRTPSGPWEPPFWGDICVVQGMRVSGRNDRRMIDPKSSAEGASSVNRSGSTWITVLSDRKLEARRQR